MKKLIKKFLLNWWPPYLREELTMSERIVRELCDEWAEIDTYVENLCLRYGIAEDKVYGNSYGVPSIEEKLDFLIQKIESGVDISFFKK